MAGKFTMPRLAVIGCMLLAITAAPLRAETWPVKQFEVLNVAPVGVGVIPFGGIVDEGLKPELAALARSIFGEDIALPELETVRLDPETKREIENYLTEVAALYESWGFGAPDLRPVVEDTNGRDAYRIYIVDGLNGAGRHSACLFDNIVVDARDVLRSGRLTDFGRLTLAHELFHAVAWNTRFFSCLDGLGGPGNWISEGLADAVAADAVRILWDADPDLNIFDEWGLRRYHEALPVPIGFFQHDRGESRDQYATASFWRYLAETHAQGAPAGPEYGGVDYSFLPPMLAQNAATRDCNARGAVCEAELRWTDFHSRQTFGEPLRALYARFMQAYVQYPGHRPNVSADQWFPGSFGACDSVQPWGRASAHGDRILAVHIPSGKIERNAAKCFAITPYEFDGEIRLRVRVYDPTGRLPIQNLSAVLGRPPSSVPKPAVSVEEGGGTAQSAAWTFEVEPEKMTYLVLTNMADDPGATIPLDGLLVEFIVLDDAANMGTASGPAEVFGALPIELDRFQMKYVIPAATELLRKRGMTEACSLRFIMLNSETGDGVEIQLDDSGPIVPKTYNAAFQKDGNFDGPEEHVGEAVIRFGIGKGNPIASGIAQTYGSQTGTFTIDAFTQDIVSGSLTVLGERDIDGKWEDSGWRDYPDELNAMAASAEFIFQPVLPRGFSSMRHCIHPDPEKRIIPKKIKKGGDEEKEEEEEEETDTTSSSPEEAVPMPGEHDEMAALPDAPGEAPAAAPGESAGEVVSVECRPLLFKRGVPFDPGPGAPFRFERPEGWIVEGDGSKGRIWPADYPDGGIVYSVRELSEREVPQAIAMNRAMFPEFATLTYGSEIIPVFGGLLGDTLNTLFILPARDGNYAVEMLFKGRTGCDPALIERVQGLFLSSFEPG